MIMPKRIQRSRAKGWKMPPNTIYCGRPGKYGNPTKAPDNPEFAARAYGWWLNGSPAEIALYGPPPPKEDIRRELKGKNLACWCGLGKPCHVDLLLKIANE